MRKARGREGGLCSNSAATAATEFACSSGTCCCFPGSVCAHSACSLQLHWHHTCVSSLQAVLSLLLLLLFCRMVDEGDSPSLGGTGKCVMYARIATLEQVRLIHTHMCTWTSRLSASLTLWFDPHDPLCRPSLVVGDVKQSETISVRVDCVGAPHAGGSW